jgi:glycosyltransferase involved in cell wall biosynthesis
MIHGGAVRMGNLIRRMSAWCDVSAFIFIGGTDDPEQRRALEPWCEHIFFQQIPAPGESAPDPWGLLPPSAARFVSSRVTERLAAMVNAHDYDIVHLEYTEMGSYIRACAPARAVLTEHDLSFSSHSRQRAIGIGERFAAVDRIGAGAVDALRQNWFEIRACERADQVHVMSQVDRDLLAAHLSDGTRRIRVVPNGVDTSLFTPPAEAERRHVLFLGSFPHLPNLDAFEFLTGEVWPAVRQLMPDARITIVGARPPDSVLEWDGRDGITVRGEVPEVAPIYRSHRVLLVPLRAGSGTRLKILEALAGGLPVVSTAIGVEGLVLSEPPEAKVADTPEGIARAVVDLLHASDEEIAEIGERGRRLAASRYDWNTVTATLRDAHRDLLRESAAPRRSFSSQVDESHETTAPDLSIIIPAPATGQAIATCLESIGRQQISRSVETVCVDWGSTIDEIATMRELGARVISMKGGRFDQGATVNAGGTAARGEVLVFISPYVVPADERWLDRLTSTFMHDRPPSAVQGGVYSHLSPCPPYSDPNLTEETSRWLEDQGGFVFSIVNAAIRRDIWARFPFHRLCKPMATSFFPTMRQRCTTPVTSVISPF